MSRVPLPLPDPPLLEGSVSLRPWGPTDARHLVAAWADAEVRRWTGVPDRSDEVAADRWIAGESDRRARGLALDLVIEVDGEVGGEIGLAQVDPVQRTAEMGWWISPRYRARHVATTAARMFGQWTLSELMVDSLTARCHPDNPASGSVARAAGFTLVGVSGEFELWRCC